MDWKVLQTQQLTGGWWVFGPSEETADLKLLLFFHSLSFLWTNPRLHFRAGVRHREGRELEVWGEGGGCGRGWDGGWGVCRGVMQHLLLCWFHPWLRTPVVLALRHQHPHPPIHLGGHPASVCSVPCLGGDQGLTNDVYAVVLVDICWQNRSPVRHLEWN